MSRNLRAELEKQAEDIHRLYSAAVAELEALNAFLLNAKEDCEFARRTKVRTVFSVIEAFITHLKRSALMHTLDQPDVFSDAERLALREIQYAVTDKGDVKEKKAPFLEFKTNLRFAFLMYGKSIGKEYRIDFSDEEGSNVATAIEIRHRITHPKTADCWKITKEQAALITTVWEWFGRHLVAVSSLDKGI